MPAGQPTSNVQIHDYQFYNLGYWLVSCSYEKINDPDISFPRTLSLKLDGIRLAQYRKVRIFILI